MDRATGALFCLWLLVLLPAGARGSAATPAAQLGERATAAAAEPLVCVVIRTYYAHGTYGDSSLINLLHSLKRQTHTRWTALLLVMDNRPFPDLRHIVRDAADERVHVFAEWISARYQPRTDDGKRWTLHYHTRLYNLTDEAVRACPKDTRWLVVTNGDNDYDPGFMAALVEQGAAGAECVAFDYYSRFQRSTATPCERFAAGAGLPPCKSNELSWCQTDLAANAYDWRRFVGDGMLFGVLDSGYGANHDGVMADVVRARRWKVARVAGRCLVEHAPSPQMCAASGGVWDDALAATEQETGGRCLESSRAAQKLQQLGEGAEIVEVDVSHDTSFGLPPGPLKLKCIRFSSLESWQAMRRFFPARCVAAVDAPTQQQ